MLLVRRIAAIVLMAMSMSAVCEFGKLDAIVHLLIVVLRWSSQWTSSRRAG
jgi:hypothetical protein